MSRIRSIKPEWLDDERLALASSDARTLSIALLLLADDYGNGRAAKVLLAGRVFPGKPIETLANALEELAKVRFVQVYEADGQQYFSIRNWSKHQRVDKPGKPQVPGPPPDPSAPPPAGPENFPGSLAKVPGSLAPDQEGRGKEGKGVERSARALGGSLPANHQTEQRAERFDRVRASLRQEFARRFHEAEPNAGLWSRHGAPEIDSLTDWLLSLPSDPDEAIKRTLDTFFADPYCRSIHFSISHLGKHHMRYFEPREAPSKVPKKETVEALREQAREATIAGDMGKVRDLTTRIKELQDAEQQQAGGRRARA